MVDESLVNAVIAYSAARSQYRIILEQVQVIADDSRSELETILSVGEEIPNLPMAFPLVEVDSDVTIDKYLEATNVLNSAIEAGTKGLFDHHRNQETALQNAGIDGLTGLLRSEKAYSQFRKLITDTAKQVLDTGDVQYFGFIHIDLDDFTSGNTTFGHPQMDKVLSGTAKRISSLLKKGKGECAIRLGGEEIGVYSLSSVKTGARTLSNKLKTEISRNPYMLQRNGSDDKIGYNQTASIGYVNLAIDLDLAQDLMGIFDFYGSQISQAHNGERKELLRQRDAKIDSLLRPMLKKSHADADSACYVSKTMGKNQVRAYDSHHMPSYYPEMRDLYQAVKSHKLDSNVALELGKLLTNNSFQVKSGNLTPEKAWDNYQAEKQTILSVPLVTS